MTCFRMRKSTLWSRLLSSSFIALTVLGIIFAATAANACANPANSGNLIALKLPFLVQPGSQGAKTNANSSIVGLWHVTYTSGGQLFYEAYDQWHRDHSEFENANLSPIEGNVCMGVWIKVGPRKVQLNHVGWSFDSNGNSNGTFTIAQTNTVSKDGATYQGTFDYKFFDVNGNLQVEVTGTTAATRITAD